MIRFPSHLQLSSHGIYYFRIAVPDALKSHLKMREIKCSLRTRFKHEAIGRALPLSLSIRDVFGGLVDSAMTYKDARVLLQRYLDQQLAAADSHLERAGPLTFDRKWNLEQGLKHQRGMAAWDLPSKAGCKAAERILQAEGIKLDPASEGFQKLAIWATKTVVAHIEGILAKDAALASYAPAQRREAANEVFAKNAASNFQGEAKANARNSQGEPEVAREVNARLSPEPHHMLATRAPQTNRPDTSAEPTFRQVLAAYTAEKLREGSWTTKTEGTAKGKLDLLLRIVGDIPMRLIGQGHARDFKQVLQRLPSNINTKPLYRSKTIQQILAMNPEAGMSVPTVNGYLTWASSLFDWAERNGYVDRNPFKKILLKNPKRPREARAAYTSADLQKLFSTTQYLTHRFKHPHYYWLPTLGLHSGARLNELCQLHLKDVRKEDGIWVLDINESDAEKRVKTRAARRLVPVHPKLIHLGFLQYVEQLRSKGETRLFPELRPMRDGAGQAASKWFARYRKPLGLYRQTPKKDFHSFRTTLINTLKQKGHPEALVAALVGHAREGLTFAVYGKAYQPAMLARVLEDLSFESELLNVRAWPPSKR